jgi:hypothetical protein
MGGNRDDAVAAAAHAPLCASIRKPGDRDAKIKPLLCLPAS